MDFSGYRHINNLANHTISLAKQFRFVFVSFCRFFASREMGRRTRKSHNGAKNLEQAKKAFSSL